jgi:hypothetical protein
VEVDCKLHGVYFQNTQTAVLFMVSSIWGKSVVQRQKSENKKKTYQYFFFTCSSYRVWWIFVIFISLYGCGKLIFDIYKKWDQSPVIVSFAEKSTPIWQVSER